MRAGILGFAVGIWLLQIQAELPGAGLLAVAAGFALALGTWIVRASGPPAPVCRIALHALFGLALGFAWAALLAHWRLADALGADWEGRDIGLTGVIASLPQPFARGVRFEFDVEETQPGYARVPKHVTLAWYNGLAPEQFQEVIPARAGERWRFVARLRRPHGLANPHGFDYEGWALERGIRATGYVRDVGKAERLDDLVHRPSYLLERLRERVRERFWDALPGAPYAGVLIALAIGEQRAIDRGEWQIFARTGVSHLMSISGLHVTMVSGLVAWLVFAIWRRAPRLVLYVPAQKAAAVAGLAAAMAYCLISGFAVPAQRTLYMVGIVALALWLERSGSASRVLALALAVVLALDPWAVLSPGFWLSFGAVALIFYTGTGRPQARGWLAQWGTVQWAVCVGLAPLLLVLFRQVSIVSPLANAVAIPLVSFVMTPLALLGAVLPVDAPLVAAHALAELLMRFLESLARLDLAVWQQHAPAAWTLPLALIGAAWLLAPRGFPSRTCGAAAMLPMFAVTPPTPAAGETWMTFLDVGQGMAVVVRTRDHALLYDAGPSWGPDSDGGARVVVPYLRGEGLASLDALIISHDDTDHSGGAASVLEAIPVGRIISSLQPDHPILAWTGYRTPCQAGRGWDWNGVRFTLLHPAGEHYANPWIRPNDRSCVLRIEAHGGTALLAGDMEQTTEHELLSGPAHALRADVLLAPHHGSGTSSSPAFVESVSPRFAIFMVGYRNRFGHPHPQAVQRYREQGSDIVRTDAAGAVTVRIGVESLTLASYRESARRYWYGR